MSIRSWSSSRIVVVWLGAIVLAAVVVRVGDTLRTTEGESLGFYVGSLFVWVIWFAWLVTWRWTDVRKAGFPDGHWRWLQVLLILFGLLWLAGTVLEYF
jgi:predicted transporter